MQKQIDHIWFSLEMQDFFALKKIIANKAYLISSTGVPLQTRVFLPFNYTYFGIVR